MVRRPNGREEGQVEEGRDATCLEAHQPGRGEVWVVVIDGRGDLRGGDAAAIARDHTHLDACRCMEVRAWVVRDLGGARPMRSAVP